MKNETKNCKRCTQNFTLEADDLSFYEKMKVPAPNVCPDCRFKMRAVWRNETALYTGRKCDLCSKSTISVYNPNSAYKVYCLECYHSDKWNPQDYAQDYDYSKSFFEQVNNLLFTVPKMAIFRTNSSGVNIGSEYVNTSGGVKNCHFIFNSGPAEEVMYSRGLRNVKDSLDIYYGVDFERSYESVNLQESSDIFWSKNILASLNSYFSENCSGCTDCFGCVNLRNQSLRWFNSPITKEKFRENTLDLMGSFSKIEKVKKEIDSIRLSFPYKLNNNTKCVDSTGDYLYECKNVLNSFEVTKSENCRYLFSVKEIKDSNGVVGYGFNSDLLLECTSTGFSSKMIGCYHCDSSRELEYCFSCISNDNNLIGCDSLKNASFCILNKQYTKEEYEKLRAHIIQELTDQGVYGLMMPPEIAPFAYNETIAQDNMPLTKEEALAQGFRWEDDIQKTEGKETLKPEEIPDHINDVSDSITKEVLCCIECNRNYKITEQELLFYRKMVLPIPRKCFYCRHKDRIERRGPYKFWNRNCAKCEKDIITNYAPDRPEIIYCEKCYQQEVY